jgi:hypothetical protein
MEKQPLLLRPGCSRVGDLAICVLFGGLLGFAFSLIYLRLGTPELIVSRIQINGSDGHVSLNPDGLTMYGDDYSQATLHLMNGKGPPLLEIRAKDGSVVFRSTPE